ncbi:MAG: SpoIIE family protein phosphatase [Pseudomonadota bacterium]
MMKNRGLAFKLTLLILSSSTIIFGVVFSYHYIFTKRIIVENARENAGNLARATVNRIDTVLRSVEKVPQNLAYFLEAFPSYSGDLMDLVRSVIENNPEIYGATVAFEPYAYNVNARSFAPYFYRQKGKIHFSYIPYDYFFYDWYQIPKELNRPVWTEPYYDEGAGGIIMSTYAVPFYRNVAGEKKLMGVVTADVSLSWLKNIVSSIKIERTGYGFLLTKNGTYVTHPHSPFIMNETIFSVAETRGDEELRKLGRKMIRGETGFVPFTSILTGKKCWMDYAPLESNGWSLGVLFPRDELMADITRLNHIVILLSLIGFLFILVVIILIAGSITRPLRALSGATHDIAAGNLDIELPPLRSRDEVGRLAESFEHMKSSLKQYIMELTETTAAKEKIESELKIAHDIQMDMLPKTFPPFPDRKEFDIYAMLKPAKEVGGDLFDFFFMDEDHLCFTVGDVSDKGVPAALFMAITRTLIKTKTTQGLTPDAVLTRVNEDLSLDNPSMMFVTLFLGVLDIRTGEIVYCNGGHNPPYVIQGDGAVRQLEPTGGMALGVMEDFKYLSKRLVLGEGEALFIYTDGVTEAMNAADQLFSEERLEKTLDRMKDAPIENVIVDVMDSIHHFSEGLPQSDDITMMMIRFNGDRTGPGPEVPTGPHLKNPAPPSLLTQKDSAPYTSEKSSA